MIFDASDNPATDPWGTPKIPPLPKAFGRLRQTLPISWRLNGERSAGRPPQILPPVGWTPSRR